MLSLRVGQLVAESLLFEICFEASVNKENNALLD